MSMLRFKITSTGPNSLLKLCLSNDTKCNLLFAMMFAALGSFLIKANSPK